MPVYMIKVRAAGKPSWSFLGGNGCTSPLRIHARQWGDSDRCITVAEEIARDNDGYDVKVIALDGRKASDVKRVTACAPIPRSPKPAVEILTGKGCYQEAVRRAKRGHKHWIVWAGKDQVVRAARLSQASVKVALLAGGTAEYFTHVFPDGFGSIVHWNLGVQYHRQLKHGRFMF